MTPRCLAATALRRAVAALDEAGHTLTAVANQLDPPLPAPRRLRGRSEWEPVPVAGPDVLECADCGAVMVGAGSAQRHAAAECPVAMRLCVLTLADDPDDHTGHEHTPAAPGVELIDAPLTARPW